MKYFHIFLKFVVDTFYKFKTPNYQNSKNYNPKLKTKNKKWPTIQKLTTRTKSKIVNNTNPLPEAQYSKDCLTKKYDYFFNDKKPKEIFLSAFEGNKRTDEEILDLPIKHTNKELKQAYKKKIKQFHPKQIAKSPKYLKLNHTKELNLIEQAYFRLSNGA